MPQVLAKFIFQHQLSVETLCLKLWPLHYKIHEKKNIWRVPLAMCKFFQIFRVICAPAILV